MGLIDANAVSALIKNLLHPAPDYGEACYNDGVIDALSEIEGTKPVDAVPVVRCKDCKYIKRLLWPDRNDAFYSCRYWLHNVKRYDFCSRAVKKEETE